MKFYPADISGLGERVFDREWGDWDHDADVSEMLGKTVEKIGIIYNEQISFYLTDGTRFVLYHSQSCCESVTIDDINGDLQDLIGEPLTMAEESSNKKEVDGGDERWTFYRFATIKGYVTIRWHGASNGYYSISVDVVRVDPEREAKDE